MKQKNDSPKKGELKDDAIKQHKIISCGYCFLTGIVIMLGFFQSSQLVEDKNLDVLRLQNIEIAYLKLKNEWSNNKPISDIFIVNAS